MEPDFEKNGFGLGRCHVSDILCTVGNCRARPVLNFNSKLTHVRLLGMYPYSPDPDDGLCQLWIWTKKHQLDLKQ